MRRYMVLSATNIDQIFASRFGQLRTMVESVHANVLLTLNFNLSNDLTTDDKSRQSSRAAQSSQRGIDLVLLRLLLTLRQGKLTFAHRCFATLQKNTSGIAEFRSVTKYMEVKYIQMIQFQNESILFYHFNRNN